MSVTPREIQRPGESVHYRAARTRLRMVLRHLNEDDWLDQYELDNLGISLAWLAAQADAEAARTLIALVNALAPVWQRHCLFGEMLRWSQEAIRACGLAGHHPGPFFLACGEAQYALGMWSSAEESFQTATQVSSEDNSDTYGKAVVALGRLQFNRGHYDQALKTFADIEHHLVSTEDFKLLTAIQAERAAYYLNHYEYDRALALYLQIDELVRARNGGQSSDHMLLMLGVVYRRKKAYSQAASYLLALLARAEKNGNRSAIATAAHHLALVYLCQGDSAQARQYCGKALALYRDIDDPRGIADAYEQAGRITLAEGHAADALADLEQSLRMKETLGSRHGMASSLRHLAIAHLACGEPLLAAHLLWRSLSLYRQLGTLNRNRLLSFFRQICYCLLGKRGWAE